MGRRRYLAGSLVVALGVGLAVVVPASPAAAFIRTSVFSATNDSYVSAAAPTTNFDAAGQLAVGASPTRITYVKFAPNGLVEPVVHARLRLHSSTVSYAGSLTGGTVQRAGSNWLETELTYNTRPPMVGAPLFSIRRVQPGQWYEWNVTDAVTGNGVVTFALVSTDADAVYYDDREGDGFAPQLAVDTGVLGNGGNVLLAAGDIATCERDQDELTARILDGESGVVAALGDLAYEGGTAEQFRQCYHPTWGRHKARTRPAAGNHEYLTANAAPYFAYFGSAAGAPDKGYYSYDMPEGGWHIVVLNSNCSKVGGCHAGSPQERWLRADLAANKAQCTLAYWHHPAFSSGGRQASNVLPLVQALYDDRAEVILSGHAHQYERFTPQTPTRAADPIRGIRQFVVGTGGRSLQTDFGTVVPNSTVRNGNTYGVLRLTLFEGGYHWRFLPIQGQTFTDAGNGVCF